MRQLVVMYDAGDGQRIMYRYAAADQEQLSVQAEQLKQQLKELDTPVAVHDLPTPDGSQASLLATDPYFEGIQDIADWDEFVTRVRELGRINAKELAAYLERFKLGPYAIQKTMYYLYADHLQGDGPLFGAKFVAFDLGPVDQESYRLLKYEQAKIPAYQVEFLTKASPELVKLVDEAATKYGKLFNETPLTDAPEQNPTHREGTPWSRARQRGMNEVITDDEIRQYHYLEVIE